MRQRRWNELFALFFDPTVPIAFFFGSLAVAVASSALFGVFTNLFGTATPALLWMVLASVAVVMLAVLALRQTAAVWARRQQQRQLIIPEHQQAPRLGSLVLPVGLSQPGAERAIIEWHVDGGKLRHCWLLVSEQVKQSSKFGDLRQNLLESNVECHTVEIADAKEFASAYYATLTALAESQSLAARGAWPALVDITGGTAVMSAGIALAAREVGASLQYYPARYEQGRLIIDSASAPQLVALVSTKEEHP